MPTAGATSTGQSAISLPPQFAALSTPEHPEAGILAYLDDRYQRTGQVPGDRFKIENGHVVETQPGWLLRNPWVWTAVGGGIALSPLLFGGGAVAAGGGGASVAGGGGTAGTAGATGGTVGTAGVTGAGTAGAAGAYGMPSLAGANTWSALPGYGTSLPSLGGSGGVLGGIGRFLSSPGGATALGIGGQLAGAAIQSSGISKAAEIEAAFQREALQYEKERDQYLQQLEANRYGELTQRLQPYIGAGQGASDRMMSLMGLSAPAPTPNVTPHMPGAPLPIPPGYDQRGPGTPGSYPTGVAVPRSGMASSSASGGLVTVQAPTGETRQLDPQMAQRAVKMGATIING
jgi:hypothetical protein